MGRKADRAENPLPADPEANEKKRLRSLAVTRKLLARSPANPSAPLEPSKAVVRLQGRDIVKRGQRRSRYLFSFPGLIAPLSGGKVGELADLATKNPVLYLEFPQGRMKLFGTHVYPKNKYLTLQLSRSAKGVMCEDLFESLIVFSDAWWIGRKEENLEEHQLEFPKELKEGKSSDYDFKGGAGATYEEVPDGQKNVKEYFEPPSPDNELDSDGADDFCTIFGKDLRKSIETTPVRQSSRAAGKALNYAESSSDEDSTACGVKAIEVDEQKSNVVVNVKAKSSTLRNKDDCGLVASSACSPENDKIVATTNLTAKTEESVQLENTRKSPIKRGALVQATLSNLFEKVAEKKPKRAAADSIGAKSPVGKRQRLLAKEQTAAVKVKALSKKRNKSSGKNGTGSRSTARSKQSQEADDWSEDISSDSQNFQRRSQTCLMRRDAGTEKASLFYNSWYAEDEWSIAGCTGFDYARGRLCFGGESAWMERWGLATGTKCPWGCNTAENLSRILHECVFLQNTLKALRKWGVEAFQPTSVQEVYRELAKDSKRRKPTFEKAAYCYTINQCWRNRLAKTHGSPHAILMVVAATVLGCTTCGQDSTNRFWGTDATPGNSILAWCPRL